MDTLSRKIKEVPSHPIRVVQFGEGNFLRAFADYMIDVANEKGVTDMGVAVVKPIQFGSLELFEKQDNLYTVVLRGQQDGKTVNDARLVTCVEKAVDAFNQYDEYAALAKLDTLKIVISNTTEAGIVFDPADKMELNPPLTFPGKLTKMLYERYQAFSGSEDKGLVIIPCELIEHNGDKLRECVLRLIDTWKLDAGFKAWVEQTCTFCCTLVDRIVTGFPRDSFDEVCQQLGYVDNLVDTAEPFGLWVIESGRDISAEFPLDQAGLPVVFTDDQTPYRERKVRILNGAHTGSVLAAYLCGFEFVGQMMKDSLMRKYVETLVIDEIVPTVKLPREEVLAFANSVFERFENPFIKHRLLDISLNSVSKWKARLLPTFRDQYHEKKALPKLLTFSFAALTAFYNTSKLEDGVLKAQSEGREYQIKDDAAVLEFFAKHSGKVSDRELVQAFASQESFWGEDLTKYSGFVDTVAAYLDQIKASGMKNIVENLLK